MNLNCRARRGGLLLVILLLSLSSKAQIIVNSTVDGVDINVGDGVCLTADGTCSFRAALQEAEAAAGPETITLPEGLYEWTLGEEVINSGDITVEEGCPHHHRGCQWHQSIFRFNDNLEAVTFEDVELRNGFGANVLVGLWRPTART